MVGIIYFLYDLYIKNENKNENIKKYNYYKKYDQEYKSL